MCRVGFRANEDVFTSEVLLKWMKSNCKKYAFQKEKSDTGYIHWQGRFSLIKKRNKSTLLKLLEPVGLPNYLQPTCEENRDVYFYAMKEDTRIGELFADPSLIKDEIYIPRQFKDKILYEWQEVVKSSADVFDDRSVNVIFDPEGNHGKSYIASLCSLLYGAISLPPSNDFKELIAVACDICMAKQTRSPKLIFCDMPRAYSKTSLFGFYSAIEQIKKGHLFDMRYKYQEYWIDSPNIWIFTNEPPDESMLSRGRWKIYTINDEKKLVPFKTENSLNEDDEKSKS